MNNIETLAAKRPLAWATWVTLIGILMLLSLAIPVSASWPGETHGWYIASAIGRLVAIMILLLVLMRLKWLSSAGFMRLAGWRTWLILLLPLGYSIAVSTYAMTGNFDLRVSNPGLAGLAAVFLIAHAFLEEVIFRGLILHGLVRAWGDTGRGPLKSVLVSSLFFGAMHIVYLAGEPVSVVLARIVVASLLGICLGALVLHENSIYPAAFFHGLLNLAGYLNLTSNTAEGTPSAWLLLSLLMLPVAVFGWVLLVSASQRVSPLVTESLVETRERL
jgi:hypothetical protein